ncbi:hypothetical protein H8E88_09825 [candidate division KSB1 bacterium]|nr:hypothetical protein [candidate division KSB1 bacterium]
MDITISSWIESETLSKQIREGKPVSQKFFWTLDNMERIHIRSSKTSKIFSREDYEAMISHVYSYKTGVPLGSRRDGTVPTDSLGALMEKRHNTLSIRGWCSHLAAIAVQKGDVTFLDKGRGPGKGIWLYPKEADVQ